MSRVIDALVAYRVIKLLVTPFNKTKAFELGIIDEKGRILATAAIYSQSIITHEVHPMKGSTPYVRWGNWLIVMLMGLILLLGTVFKRKQN